MQTGTAEIVFPPSARAAQTQRGSREAMRLFTERHGFPREVDETLIQFLARLNSFYMATATVDGLPYIQHRGGPRGFLRVLGPTTLGFADFRGNRQYITVGRLAENNGCCLIMTDYARQARVKLWGRARIEEEDKSLLTRLTDPAYSARVERAIIIEIDAWSENCRQHIPQRFDADEVISAFEDLSKRIQSLESENQTLRAWLALHGQRASETH